MNAPDVKKIVEEWLEDSEYDGLASDFDCGCLKSDLMPCGNPAASCEPAYRFDCARCGKAGSCRRRPEGCGAWVMSGDKDFCEPDYAGVAPAAAYAAENAALPACAPPTAGDMERAGLPPDWYAQGGIGEAPEDALKIEPGEVILPIGCVAEAIAKAIKDSAPKPKTAALAMPLPAKEACQNTAKTEAVSRALKEDRTAEYMRFLEFGA